MDHNWNDIFSGSVIGSEQCIAFCDENKTHVLASLPVVIAELAGIGGFKRMFQLINRYGGVKIYLPKSSANFSSASGIDLPEEAYSYWRRLAKLNGQIEVPSKWGVFLALRRAAIYKAIKDGTDIQTVTMDYGITQRQVRNIKNKYY